MRMKVFRTIFLVFSVVVLPFVATGCGEKGPKTVQGTGVVTYKGEPVEGANVMFSPITQGQGVAALGKTDAAGKFTLQTVQGKAGAVPGEYAVVITKTEMVPTGEKVPKPEGGTEDVMINKDLLPQKYKFASSTPLKVKIEEGKVNEFQFNLED